MKVFGVSFGVSWVLSKFDNKSVLRYNLSIEIEKDEND
jgi:hypothetical protein